jgi:hypothetical protein
MTKTLHWAFGISMITFASPSLPAQEMPAASLSLARAVLHSSPLLVPNLPIVVVRARPCANTAACPDSMIEIEQVFDSTTHVTVRQWWVGPATRRSGWLERCRHDLRNPDRASDVHACPEPGSQAIIHGLWVEIHGPLPQRVLAGLLAQLELAPSPINGS